MTDQHRLRNSHMRRLGLLILASACMVAVTLTLSTIFTPDATAADPEPSESESTAEGGGAPVLQEDKDAVLQYAIDQAHAACFENECFPSAAKCASCHPQHYREWSVSPHAYAQLSPVFNAFQATLVKFTSGTNGDFCIRCHTPVGMEQNESINMSNLDRSLASREGVTCVVCHRVNQAWGKGSGRRALVAGNLNAPVYGPIGNQVLAGVLADPDKYGVLETRDDPAIRGRNIHGNSIRFFQITTSGFCGNCHDVFAPNGFRLEDAFSEYKASPSARIDGHSCQDCHMGAVPGEAKGYTYGPAAIVGNASTPSRKHTNHMIAGPDYSIIHRGLFPHNYKAVREENDTDPLSEGLATMREWLTFDDQGGWGTKRFEEQVQENWQFPYPWDDQKKRYEARAILNDQYELLAEATSQRLQLYRAGFKLSDVCIDRADDGHLKFHVEVANGTRGHGVPTGFDAERVIFLRTMVWNPQGRLVFQSGDLDPNGDVRDSHSYYVHNGELPLDRQLFSLQTRFITRNLRGGEREQILAVPYSLDPLPYTRPETRPFTVLGRPIGARKHKQNIEPNGFRNAKYYLGENQLTVPGDYTIRVQLIAGMVPINLVKAISGTGFDFGMSARDIAKGVVDGHLIIHERVKRVCVQ